MLLRERMLPGSLGRRWLRALAIGGAAMLAASQPAVADGCLLHPAKLADAAVEGFKARPQAMLDDYPDGGVVMTAAVRRLAGTEVAIVPDLIALAKGAKIPQIVAIGAGLAGAVNVCRAKRPDLAQKLSDKVRESQIPALFAAFAASLSSRQVATMGAPLGPATTPGLAPLVDAQVKAPPVDDVDSGAPKKKRPFGEEPRASFGNGGIVRTVVKPVSPAR
jgi:hypothetical protein